MDPDGVTSISDDFEHECDGAWTSMVSEDNWSSRKTERISSEVLETTLGVILTLSSCWPAALLTLGEMDPTSSGVPLRERSAEKGKPRTTVGVLAATLDGTERSRGPLDDGVSST